MSGQKSEYSSIFKAALPRLVADLLTHLCVQVKCVRGRQSCTRCETAGIACSYSDNVSNRQNRSQQAARSSGPSRRLSRQQSGLDQPSHAGIEEGFFSVKRRTSRDTVSSITGRESQGSARPEAKSRSFTSRQSQPQRRKSLSVPGRQSLHYHPYNGSSSASPNLTNSVEIGHQTVLGKGTVSDGTGDESPSESGQGAWKTSHANEASHDPITLQGFGHNSLDLDRFFNNNYFDNEGNLAELEPWSLSSSDPRGRQKSVSESSQQGRPEIPNRCTCLSMVVALMDDLDLALRSTVNVSDLDSMLQSNKVALSQARQILDCTDCSARSEHIALLTRVCDALAKLAGNAAAVLLQVGEAPNWSPPSSSTLSPCQPVQSLQRISPELSQPPPSFEDAEPSVVHCGRYEADASEWECVLRLLTIIQIRALHQFLDDLKGHTTQLHFSRLESIKLRTRGLLDRLQPPIG